MDLLTLLSGITRLVRQAFSGMEVTAFTWVFVPKDRFDAIAKDHDDCYELGEQGPSLRLAAGKSSVIIMPEPPEE